MMTVINTGEVNPIYLRRQRRAYLKENYSYSETSLFIIIYSIVYHVLHRDYESIVTSSSDVIVIITSRYILGKREESFIVEILN